MSKLKNDVIRRKVRETYEAIARSRDDGCDPSSCCGPEEQPSAAGDCGQRARPCCSPAEPTSAARESAQDVSSCCSPGERPSADDLSAKMGYSAEEVSAAPQGSNMGLGCGNPQAIASLRPGETVLDLGSGGGFDCFLAANAVGETGHVIGVDMTPEMVTKAREAAGKNGFDNVEFRLGEIESIPAADGSVDAIISNCVINLSPEKERVFEEAYRVLRPGGRLAVSDIVATAELPPKIAEDLSLHAGCVAGAATIDSLQHTLEEVGFEDVRIKPKEGARELIGEWMPGRGLENYITSATIEARKPA